MPQNKINVAVIGSGFGLSTHMPAFARCSNVNLYSFFSRQKTLRKEINTKYNLVNFPSLDSMFDDEKIDLISIATPPHTHKSLCERAIMKRKHVFCEKPFGLSSKETKKLIDLAKSMNVNVYTGYQLRFDPARETIKNFVSSKDFGPLVSANIQYHFSSRIQSEPSWNWWSDIRMGGGALYNMGSHHIDNMLWMFGKPNAVIAKTNNFNKRLKNNSKGLKKVTADESFEAIFLFRSNLSINMSISSTALGWKNTDLKIYGSNASIFLSGESNVTLFRKTTAQHEFFVKDDLVHDKWTCGSIWRAAFYRQVEDIVNSVIANKKSNAASIVDSLNTHLIMEAIHESSKNKSLIKIQY